MSISIWFLLFAVSLTRFSDASENWLAKSLICQDQNRFENFNLKVENLNINGNTGENEENIRGIHHSSEASVHSNRTFEPDSNSTVGILPSAPNSTVGILPTNIPHNCAEAVRLSGRTEGVHKIQIRGSHLKPFYVYCLADPKGNGSAWTLVQRRIDGSVNFQKRWKDYVLGFGNLQGEFFIGLEKLHELTRYSINELWIQMEDFEDNTRFAKYSNFAIDGPSGLYALKSLGSFTGDAGDSLKLHIGQKFSTIDVDLDSDPLINCAEKYTGAWWYYNCQQSNLNGQYLGHNSESQAQGIIWSSWKNSYSLKYVHMAIRS